ncbi:MAG: spinster family MFS transporter [Sphingomonadaceae bacterium]
MSGIDRRAALKPLDEADAEPRYSPLAAWCTVAILLLFSLIAVLDRQIIALLVEPIKKDLSLSDTELGLLQGFAFALFYSLAGVPIGWAVDRYSRRIIAYLGVTVWSLSAAACGLAGGFWPLFACRTMVGVGEASVTPTAVSLIGDLFPREKVGAPMGVYAAGFYVGSGLALAIGGFVVGLFAGQDSVNFPIIGPVAPWQAVLLTTGAPGILIAFLAFFLKDARKAIVARADRPAPSMSALLADRGRLIAITYVGFALAAFVAYAIGAWTPAFLWRKFGLLPQEIGWTWGIVVSVSGAAGALLGGFAVDRVHRMGRHDANLIVPAIAALISWPLLTTAYFLPSPFAVLLTLGLGMGVFSMIAAGSYATWRQIAPPQFRGQITAGFTVVSGLLGAGMGPVSVALVTDYVFGDEAMVGISLAIVLSIAIPAIAILLATARPLARHLDD